MKNFSPTERPAYVLYEAFDYSHSEIADILQMEEANTRRRVSRARKHIVDGRRMPASLGEQQRLLETFLAAAEKGELAALEDLLADGATRIRGWTVDCHRCVLSQFIRAGSK